MSVIRSAIAVLSDGPAKLRHRQNYDVVHPLAQVLIERRDSVAELLQQVRELATTVSLILVRVPLAHVGKRDFQTDFGFDQLRDLPHRVAERVCWINRAV